MKPPEVGLGWRGALAASLLKDPRAIDLVEVVAESCYTQGRTRREALALRELWPVIPHGVKLSLGSAEGIDLGHARRLGILARELRAPCVSEHVAFTQSGEREIGHLTQLPRTRAALRVLQKNVAALRRCLPDIPLYLENIAWTFTWPDDEMSEGDFYHEVVAATGCELLLDASNLYANALNQGRDPLDLLRSYPLSRVAMVHLAGGAWEDGFYYDTHAHPTPGPVFALLAELARLHRPVPVIIERDAHFPRVELLLDELAEARRAMQGASPGIPAEVRPFAALGGEVPGEAERLRVAQRAVAECLTSDAPLPAELVARFGATPLARSRRILARKRVDDALPLLGRLGRHPEAWALGERAVLAPRAPRGVAVADAYRIAVLAREIPGLAEDAALDLLELRARFAGPAKDGSLRPRWFPFFGRASLPTDRRTWAIKGPGHHARVWLRGP